MEGEGEGVAKEEVTVKGEVVATLGTVSDTNYWANAVDATVARNVSPEKSLALLMENPAAPPEITGAILHPWQPDPYIRPYNYTLLLHKLAISYIN